MIIIIIMIMIIIFTRWMMTSVSLLHPQPSPLLTMLRSWTFSPSSICKYLHNDQAADDDGNDNDDADDDDNANDQAADDDKVEDDDLIRYENVSENIDASQLNVFSKLDMQIWLQYKTNLGPRLHPRCKELSSCGEKDYKHCNVTIKYNHYHHHQMHH